MKRSQIFLFLATLACLSAFAATASAQVSAPYFEDFESENTCGTTCGNACVLAATGWTNDTVNDDQDWTVDVGGTSSFNTGPSVDHTLGTSAGKYLYTETSGSCSGGDTFHLISPPLDVSGGTAPFARFWYHMFGGDMGTMHVDILDNTQAVLALDVIPAFTDDVDLWQQTPNIDLTPYLGQIIHVRIRSISGPSFESDMAVDDFEFLNPVPNDVGVSTIDILPPACGAGLETVTVTLENYGTSSQSNFDVQYVYDGGAAVVETFSGTLAPGATASFSFATQIDLSVSGPHTLDVSTLLPGDQNTSNDTNSTVLNTPTVFNSYPYLDDLEGATSWVSGGAGDEWELGSPSFGNLNGANSGVNAWVTDLDDTYENNSDNFISPNGCFDFSGLTNPAIQLAVNWYSEFSWDGAVLQSSIDAGGSWQNVGAFNDGATNWYNDDTINGAPGGQQEGWTGQDATGSGGWVIAVHEMSALAGQPDVRFRIAFGSDGSVNAGRGGFAFDDFQIFDNTTPEVIVAAGTASVSIGGVAPGTTDVAVQSLSFSALGSGNQEVNSVTITKVGNIMDVYVTAKFYVDDGDGIFNPAVDTLVDTQAMAAGSATFNTMGGLSIPSLAGTVTAFIAYDLDINSMPGETFGSSVVAAADIASPAPVTIINAPLVGPTYAIAGQVDMLPFTDDFTNAPLNLLAEFAAGVQYPTATQAGPTVMLGPSTTNDAQMQIVPSSPLTALLPVDGTNFLVMNFPNSTATAALDYSFDLSAYTAATDILWLEYVFGDVGADSSDDDNIFVSLDGGATWSVSLRKFDGSEADNTWNTEVVDVSTALANAALDYSNDVLIRFQNGDNINNEAWFLDRVTLGEAPRAEVERVPMTVIPVAGQDMVGTIGAAPQSFMYTITNTGDFDLPIANNSYQFANDMNVSNVAVIGPMDATIPAGGSINFQVDFEPGVGAFAFDVSFITTDPYIFNNTYSFSVMGEGAELLAEIDVQRPAGTSIASGMSDTQGEVTVGEAQTLTYTIENVGFGVDLNVTGASIANATGATATVTSAPAGVVAPGMTTTFDVEYTADAAGSWSFEVVVASDDADEGTYTIVVDGTAVDPPDNTGGGGSGAAGGAGGSGGSTGGSDGSGGGTTGGDGEDDGGCGCSTPGRNHNGNAALLGLWALGMVLARRRQRRN